MIKAFDVHIHCSEVADDLLIPYARFNGLNYNLSELLHLMSEHGVSLGLLLSPPLNNGKAIPNRRILELCSKSQDKLFPILTADPSRDKVSDCVALAKLQKGIVRGFKIRLGYISVYPDDELFDPLYDYATSENLPVMFHTGDTAIATGSLKHSHPLTLDALANKRQEMKIVACHFGNPWFADVGELIYKHPNMFADISGLCSGTEGRYSQRYLDYVAKMLNHAIYFAGGAGKIMFGTDYPIETYSVAFQLVDRLDLQQEDKQRLLSGNAKEVFQL